MPYNPIPQEQESGLSPSLKLAIAAVIVIFLIGIVLSAVRRNSAPPPAPASETR
jgi:ABC-type dipeptide/oligopeptide/nickel transport system permease component